MQGVIYVDHVPLNPSASATASAHTPTWNTGNRRTLVRHTCIHTYIHAHTHACTLIPSHTVGLLFD